MPPPAIATWYGRPSAAAGSPPSPTVLLWLASLLLLECVGASASIVGEAAARIQSVRNAVRPAGTRSAAVPASNTVSSIANCYVATELRSVNSGRFHRFFRSISIFGPSIEAARRNSESSRRRFPMAVRLALLALAAGAAAINVGDKVPSAVTLDYGFPPAKINLASRVAGKKVRRRPRCRCPRRMRQQRGCMQLLLPRSRRARRADPAHSQPTPPGVNT